MYEVVEHYFAPLPPTTHGIYTLAADAVEVKAELEKTEYLRVRDGDGSLFQVVDLAEEPVSDFDRCECHVYKEVPQWPVGSS